MTYSDQVREQLQITSREEWKAEIIHVIGYDPSQTRVLEMKDNPSSKFYGELQAKRNAIGMQGQTSTAELKSLQKEVESKEKTIIRLKQVFQSKIQEYRSFVTNLLGYNLDMDMDGKSCTVKSVLNQEGKDPVFYYWMDGEETNIKVMGGNQIAAEIQNLLQKYVSNDGNYPGFFANVLLLLQK
jgi:hypothetical protein